MSSNKVRDLPKREQLTAWWLALPAPVRYAALLLLVAVVEALTGADLSSVVEEPAQAAGL